jgi:hypothetical protein
MPGTFGVGISPGTQARVADARNSAGHDAGIYDFMVCVARGPQPSATLTLNPAVAPQHPFLCFSEHCLYTEKLFLAQYGPGHIETYRGFHIFLSLTSHGGCFWNKAEQRGLTLSASIAGLS